MSFSVGDKVAFKKDTIKGEILSIESPYKVTILCVDGFEMSVSVNDLVKIEERTYVKDVYTDHLDVKDSDPKLVKSKNNKRRKRVLKVDLHIEALDLVGCKLDNAEIIRIQLEKCYEGIERAINSNITKLEIIHGIGKGILRCEVHSILASYNLRFYLTQDEGATEVYF